MAKEKQEKTWHPNFKEYMEFIVSHENYRGLKFNRKKNGEIAWIATKKSKVGQERIKWAEEKARELGIPIEPGVFAKVMLEIHPLKKKPCQICGTTLSLYYVYPSVALLNALKKEFEMQFGALQSIFEIADILLESGKSETQIKSFFINKFGLQQNCMNLSIKKILEKCEELCRNGTSNMLGPGAMSNFPDRFDGFHTYNRCCRSKHDTGRTAENLRTYNKDRRAYELWSDGNLHAANLFMKSDYFIGSSADHIGPISLGFKHDPLLLQKMPKGDNSSKRDRLLYEDIEKIVKIEEENKGFTAMSWFSEEIWNYIRTAYTSNKDKIEEYRIALKQNVSNFMKILWEIKKQCKNNGEYFLIKYLLEPKLEYFKYDYKFNENGKIYETTPRNITDATKKEKDRLIRIALESVDEYHNKKNRNMKASLDKMDIERLNQMCMLIINEQYDEAYNELKSLMYDVQQKIIKKIQ
jgi:Alw26I/Eco31I/Esp3I family type II restriction endonuclease